MLAWVVMFRRHHAQPRKPRSIRLFPSASLNVLSFFFRTSLHHYLLTSSFPYLLPSSVSRNPFPCHSYENCRGVYQQFPFWNVTANAEKELS
jgi:hypothetical protein